MDNTDKDEFARPDDIEAVLGGMRRVAVVGLSSDPSRESYEVASYLQAHGFDVIPVNPKEAEILGVRCYSSLADLPEPPEMVDVFRRPEAVNEVVEDAIAAGAKAVWMQRGVINPEAARRAREAGLIVVMDRCMMMEHRRRSSL